MNNDNLTDDEFKYSAVNNQNKNVIEDKDLVSVEINQSQNRHNFWVKIKLFLSNLWIFIKNTSLKVWSKIKQPYGFFLALFYILSFLIIGLTIIFVVIGIDCFINYILYVMSFIMLIYLIYSIVYIVPKLKNNIINFANKYKFTSEILKNYGFRTFIFTIISFVINTAFAIFQGTIAFLSHSYWYMTLSVYYIIFSIMRGGLIKSKTKSKNKSPYQKDIDDAINHKKIGITLIFLTIVLSGIIVLCYFSENTYKYSGILIYVVALYTFYKLSLAIYNIIKAKKTKDISLLTIRNIGFADSLVSLLSLQVALLLEFGTGDTRIFNILTGAGISALIITLGIIMIVGSNKNLKNKEYMTNE